MHNLCKTHFPCGTPVISFYTKIRVFSYIYYIFAQATYFVWTAAAANFIHPSHLAKR